MSRPQTSHHSAPRFFSVHTGGEPRFLDHATATRLSTSELLPALGDYLTLSEENPALFGHQVARASDSARIVAGVLSARHGIPTSETDLYERSIEEWGALIGAETGTGAEALPACHTDRTAPYTLTISEEDADTIRWVGNRYEWSAALIATGLDRPGTHPITEHVAWKLADAFAADTIGRHSAFPLLAPRSALAAALTDFWESIV